RQDGEHGWLAKFGALRRADRYTRCDRDRRPDPNWRARNKNRPASGLVGALADPVARWIVVADPYLAPGIAGNRASHFAGSTPDELRVMAADGPAGVGTIRVIARFRCPGVDHLIGRSVAAGNFKKIFAEDGVRAMIKLP